MVVVLLLLLFYFCFVGKLFTLLKEEGEIYKHLNKDLQNKKSEWQGGELQEEGCIFYNSGMFLPFPEHYLF